MFNNGLAFDITELYHENAVNHQVANEPITEKSAIREMFEQEFKQAEMTCIPENIFVDED